MNHLERIARLGDLFLARFVPTLDRPVQAADCWYEYRCVYFTKQQRNCCRPATGGVRCGPWGDVGTC